MAVVQSFREWRDLLWEIRGDLLPSLLSPWAMYENHNLWAFSLATRLYMYYDFTLLYIEVCTYTR